MKTTIGILGGTGKEGRGLALRWARVGHRIVLGSRDAGRASAAAEPIRQATRGEVEGATNHAAAEEAEIVVLAIPFEAQATILSSLRASLDGKIVVDAVVPIDFSARHPYAPPEEGSAAEQAQALLGPRVRVVAALHHIAAHDLARLDRDLCGDVLVAGDDQAAKSTVASLVQDLGAHAIDVGSLRQAPVIEALTTLLIQINRIHKTKSAGIRVTGIAPHPNSDERSTQS